MKNALFTVFTIILLASCSTVDRKLDITGKWTVRLDSADIGKKESWQGKLYETTIQLPGTTDDAKLGFPTDMQSSLEKTNLQHLARIHQYIGPAWYSRVISVPANWEDKDLYLNLERTLCVHYGILKSG